MNNLGGSDGLGVALDELIAFCKSTFTKELALYILPVAHLTIRVLDLLFDDLGGLILLRMQISLTTAMLPSRQWLVRPAPSVSTLALRAMIELEIIGLEIVHILMIKLK